jgi:hypothetical protein
MPCDSKITESGYGGLQDVCLNVAICSTAMGILQDCQNGLIRRDECPAYLPLEQPTAHILPLFDTIFASESDLRELRLPSLWLPPHEPTNVSDQTRRYGSWLSTSHSEKRLIATATDAQFRERSKP